MPSLEESARERRQRLDELRRRKEGGGGGGDDDKGVNREAEVATDGQVEPIEAKEVFRFRNFDPTTREAKRRTLATASTALTPTIEASTALLTAQALAEDAERRAKTSLDLGAIQPRRANWDLKRDYERLWETRLRRETERAITSLIRQRLQGRQPVGGAKSEPQGLTGDELTAAVLTAEAEDRREQEVQGEDEVELEV